MGTRERVHYDVVDNPYPRVGGLVHPQIDLGTNHVPTHTWQTQTELSAKAAVSCSNESSQARLRAKTNALRHQ